MVLQINFSSTQRGVEDLSRNFSENVGSDDTVVFGPKQITFKSSFPLIIFFDQPFLYRAAQGNLIFDVRVSDASGTNGPRTTGPTYLLAQDVSTDEVSSVWTTNVAAAVATGADTTGLSSALQFTPVPSLQIEFRSVFGTNRPVLTWPAQPSAFVPQTSARLGNNAVWQTITNGILGSPAGPDRAIYLPEPSPGTAGFFRLIWESGQSVQPATVPLITVKPGQASQTK
jgi:hypothetical protein